VRRVLVDAGHEVVLLREYLAPDSPDPLVAAVSEMNDAVLVSMDRDFQSLAPRIGIGRSRFRRLSRIALRCCEPQAAGRVKVAMSLIEHEWKVARSSSDKRMIVEIGTTHIRTIR
jgi:hypothetical protein